MVFCNITKSFGKQLKESVTILILVDGFLQLDFLNYLQFVGPKSHNPYFSRWFSAIHLELLMHYYLIGHNPYFSRWFSAITLTVF